MVKFHRFQDLKVGDRFITKWEYEIGALEFSTKLSDMLDTNTDLIINSIKLEKNRVLVGYLLPDTLTVRVDK